MFKNIKKDWWLANSLVLIITGIGIFLIKGAINGNFEYGIFSGLFNLLMGLALLFRSRIVFWIYLVIISYGFLEQILRLANVSKTTGDFSIDLAFTLRLVIFAMGLMLWQQIRKEKKLGK